MIEVENYIDALYSNRKPSKLPSLSTEGVLVTEEDLSLWRFAVALLNKHGGKYMISDKEEKREYLQELARGRKRVVVINGKNKYFVGNHWLIMEHIQRVVKGLDLDLQELQPESIFERISPYVEPFAEALETGVFGDQRTGTLFILLNDFLP